MELLISANLSCSPSNPKPKFPTTFALVAHWEFVHSDAAERYATLNKSLPLLLWSILSGISDGLREEFTAVCQPVISSLVAFLPHRVLAVVSTID